jgi:N-methylhydantoinase A
MATMKRTRLGVDIGGTFTDAVLMEEEGGRIHLLKLPSTPGDPSEGYLEIARRILHESSIDVDTVHYSAHGTTVATNTIIEEKGAKIALVTTKGFRDIFEIARQIRPKLYDIFCDKPKPLVPRHLCFEVSERLNYLGEVLETLDEGTIQDVIEKLRKEKVEAVVVCLLHSYVNPDHERRVGEMISAALPSVFLSLSSNLCPEMREYFRASTTAVNALIMPVVTRYLRALEYRLSHLGIPGELRLMTSSGGIVSSSQAQLAPVRLIESGPAAGITAATYISKLAGYENLISFDMGGTTAKAGLVERGSPKIVSNYEVGSAAVAENRSSGYPVRTPTIDLIEIGAGGGSIAWVDSGGSMRLGPRSGGANPGPACYGKGQTQPCVTDANLVLGRIDPEYFLGGAQRLYPVLARDAVLGVGEQVGLDLLETANGIVEIAIAKMAAAIRVISVQRGFDPAEFVLVAFGGAGPMHANAIARELSIPRVLVPMSPGVTCALGLLVSDLKHDYSHTFLTPIRGANLAAVNGLFDDFVAMGRGVLDSEYVSPEAMSFHRHLDLRYIGQSYELEIPVGNKDLENGDLEDIEAAFFREHQRTYGFATMGEPIEIVNVKLTAKGIIERPRLKQIEFGDENPSMALKRMREVFFSEAGGLVSTSVYDRYRLLQGDAICGPAIIEEIDSTTVIHPGYTGKVDGYGNILIERNNA